MKKISLLSLCFVIMTSISACGQQPEPTSTPPEVQNTLPGENANTTTPPAAQTQELVPPSTTPSDSNPAAENTQTTTTSPTQKYDFLKNIQGKWTQVMTRSGENDLDEYYRQELCWMKEKYEMNVILEYSETENGYMSWKYITNDRIRRDWEVVKADKETTTGGYILTVKLDQIEEEVSQTHQIRIVPVEGDVWHVEDAGASTFMITKNPKEYPVEPCE